MTKIDFENLNSENFENFQFVLEIFEIFEHFEIFDIFFEIFLTTFFSEKMLKKSFFLSKKILF